MMSLMSLIGLVRKRRREYRGYYQYFKSRGKAFPPTRKAAFSLSTNKSAGCFSDTDSNTMAMFWIPTYFHVGSGTPWSSSFPGGQGSCEDAIGRLCCLKWNQTLRRLICQVGYVAISRWLLDILCRRHFKVTMQEAFQSDYRGFSHFSFVKKTLINHDAHHQSSFIIV